MKRNKVIIGIIVFLAISVCVLFVSVSRSDNDNIQEGAIVENRKNDIIEPELFMAP